MKKILVVEDDPMIGKILELKLKNETDKKGITVDIHRVADGVAAIDAACSQSPDIIILDLMLPKKSGFEVLQEHRLAAFVNISRLD